MSERALHKAVVDYLNVALPKDAVFLHVMNEGKRGWKAQRDVKDTGVLAGAPDLFIFWNQRTTFIEFKAEKGFVSKQQKAIHAKLRALGFNVFVCRSIDEVVNALLSEAIPVNARIST